MNLKTCVKNCPILVGNTPNGIDCYAAGNGQTSCAYTVTINSSGQANTTITTTDIIGYDTYSVIGRACIPSATVFKNAFSSYTLTFSDRLRQAGIANFVTDIQAVLINLYRIGNGSCFLSSLRLSFHSSSFSYSDVSPAVSSGSLFSSSWVS